jgi:hypothetical protein
MPRADEPRVPVRLSRGDFAIIEAAAKSVNVAVGALMRECAAVCGDGGARGGGGQFASAPPAD